MDFIAAWHGRTCRLFRLPMDSLAAHLDLPALKPQGLPLVVYSFASPLFRPLHQPHGQSVSRTSGLIV